MCAAQNIMPTCDLIRVNACELMLPNLTRRLRQTVSNAQEILCPIFLQSDLSKDLFLETKRHALAEARIYSARKEPKSAKQFHGYFLRRDILLRTPATLRTAAK